MRHLIILFFLNLVLGCSNSSGAAQGTTSVLGFLSPVSSYKLERKHSLTLPSRANLYIPLPLSDHGKRAQALNSALNEALYTVMVQRFTQVQRGVRQESAAQALQSADQLSANFLIYATVQRLDKDAEAESGSDSEEELDTSNRYRVALDVIDVVQGRVVDRLMVSAAKGFMNFDDARESFSEVADLVAKNLVAY